MAEEDGLIAAYILDGKGRSEALDWDGVRSWSPQQGPVWIHLNRGIETARRWLENDAGLDPMVIDAMLAEDPRPRATPFGAGLLVTLRGVNVNPGADPEDMVSMRLWLEDSRVISVRSRPLMAVQDIRDEFAAGAGPKDTGALITRIALHMVDRMGPVVSDLDDDIDSVENTLLTGRRDELRAELAALRRQAIMLRRYLAPQRDVLGRLSLEQRPSLGDKHRLELREIGDHVTRYVEDLDAARERAAVVQEEIAARLAEEMNQRMYLLSIATAVFLPLGLLTGLLGINVGGMPGVESGAAFWLVCGLLLVVAGATLVFLRRRGLM